MIVRRTDLSRFRKAEVTPAGYLRADAYPTRAGVFVYQDAAGNVTRELRHPDDVFDETSLSTLAMVPVTNGHPSNGVNADNARDVQRGSTGERVDREGNFVRTRVSITDASLFGSVRDGKVELSCGYTCEVVPEEGEFEGERFDHRQKKIVYDHVAVVEQGRAGRECRLRLDGAHQLSDNGGDDEPVDQPKEKKMKIKIAGKEVEVSDDVAKAYEQEQAAAKADADTAASKLKDAQAKCDELQGKLDVALKSRSDEDDKKKIQEAVKARVALVRDAARFLGDTKIDEMSDLDVKRAVIAKVQPELKLDGKGPEYIGGAFEFVVSAASATNGENALDRLGNVLRGDAGGSHDDLPDPDKAHAEMVKRNADAVSEYRKRLLG